MHVAKAISSIFYTTYSKGPTTGSEKLERAHRLEKGEQRGKDNKQVVKDDHGSQGN